MPESGTREVRYNLAVAVPMLVLGVLALATGLLSLLRGELVALLVIGALMVLAGVLMLVRPYFRVGPGEVEVVGLLGVGDRTFPCRTLVVDDGALMAEAPDDTRRRVPVQRWFSRRADWDAVVGTVAT